MIKTIFRLAFDDMKKTRRSILVQFLVILIISTIYFSYLLCSDHYTELLDLYHEKRYGTWYAMSVLERDDNYYARLVSLQEEIARVTSDELPEGEWKLNCGFMDRQGETEGLSIVRSDEILYEMCRINLLEGKYPAKENEIALTEEAEKKLKAEVGDSLTLTVNGEEGNYTVSGILSKSQDLFPDIYTAVEGNTEGLLYFTDSTAGVGITDTVYLVGESMDYDIEYRFNRYGKDHAGSLWVHDKENVDIDNRQVILVEMVVLIALILYALYSATLKSRAREFALLRGIGMTRGQLFFMAMLETFIVCSLSILTGLILGLLVTSGWELWLKNRWGVFTWYSIDYYREHWKEALGLYAALDFAAFLGIFRPLLKAGTVAMSGSFESSKLSFLQHHRKKLRPLTTRRLALLELLSDKRTLLGFLGFMTALCILVLPENIGGAFTHYTGSSSLSDRQVSSLFYVDLDEEQASKVDFSTLRYEDSAVYDYLWISYEALFPCSESYTRVEVIGKLNGEEVHENLEGRLPAEDDEILIRKNEENVKFNFEVDQWEEDRWINQTEVTGVVGIGDVITIQEKQFTVTGMIDPYESIETKVSYEDQDFEETRIVDLYYTGPEFLCTSVVYMTGAAYDGIIAGMQNGEELYERRGLTNDYDPMQGNMTRLYCRNPEDVDYCMNELARQLGTLAGVGRSAGRILSVREARPEETTWYVSYSVFIVPSLIGLVIFYLIHSSKMFAEAKDFIVLRSIGTTKMDMVKKQAWKAVYLTLGVLVLVVIYALIKYKVQNQWTLSLPVILIYGGTALLFYLGVYILPLISVSKLTFEDIQKE